MLEHEQINLLLIEDNPDDADLALRALRKRHLLNTIKVLSDGEEAIHYLLRRGPYEGTELPSSIKLILLDLKLPKLNGFEVLHAIRNDERTKRIPVVILTSSQEDPDIQKAYALGANSYVVKPVDFDNFSKCVSDLGMY
jgi:CheY-like chemotaxis protein